MSALSSIIKSKAEEAGYKFIQVHQNDVNFKLKLNELQNDEYCVIMYPSVFNMQIEANLPNGRDLYQNQIFELCKKSESSGTRANLDETYQQKLDNRLEEMIDALKELIYSCFGCSVGNIILQSASINTYINRYSEGVDGVSCNITCEIW